MEANPAFNRKRDHRALISRRDWLKQIVAAAASGYAGNSLRGQSPASTAAAMQLGWIWNVEYAGQVMALENGYYTKEGLDMEVRAGGPQVDEVVMLMARKVIVTVTDVMTAGQAATHGAKIRIIGSTLQKAPFSITSLPDKPIHTPKDLIGKKIGVPSKQSWALKFLCAANGIDPKAVTVFPAGYDPAPLVNHQVDGFVSFVTNQPIQLAQQGIATVSMLFADFGLSEFSDTLTVREDSLRDAAQRAVLKQILRGTIRGWQDAVEKPEKTAKAVMARSGAQYGLDESAQLKSLQAEIPLISTPASQKNGLLTMSEEDIASNIETMARVGVPISRDLFDSTLVQEVMGGRARL